jgi:uncharacterized membrane protein YfcA
LFTACGALIGGLIAFTLPDRVLAGLFALLLLYTAYTMAKRRETRPAGPVAAPVTSASPASPASVPTPGSPAFAVGGAQGAGLSSLWSAEGLLRLSGPGYTIRNPGRGVVGAFFAGIVSAILGVGGGIVKVPVMHLMMGVPLRIATATSNLMIGVTATASAVIYVMRGGIDPYVVGPIAVGVFIGASAGSRIAPRVDVRLLRLAFVVVMLYTAVQMILRAAGR